MQRRAALAALAALLLATVLPPSAHACTSLILGRGASRDGSMWLARNVDYFFDSLQTNNLKCAGRCRRCCHRAPQHQSVTTPNTDRPRRRSPAAALRDSPRHHPAHPNGFIWKAAFNNFTYLIPGPRQAYTAAPGSNIRWARISSVEEYGWNAAGVVSCAGRGGAGLPPPPLRLPSALAARESRPGMTGQRRWCPGGPLPGNSRLTRAPARSARSVLARW